MAAPTPAQIARDLLALGAVALRPRAPFTWASGWRSPIYCDNRLTLSDPAVRTRLTDGFAATIKAEALQPRVIAGTATAGIPHAAWLAHRLEAPMVYVRAKAKAHGRGNQIEGRLEPGARVVLVEDLVSTGGSSLAAVEALRAAGAEVLAVLAIFSYGFDRAAEAFAEADVPLYTLTDYATLVDEARALGRLSDEEVAELQAWRAHPESWGQEHEAA